MSLFLISATRSIIEMIGLCMIGQAMLYFLAGRNRATNPVYQLFDLITKPPRHVTAVLLPASSSPRMVGLASFVVLLLLWLGLAFVRKFV